VRYPFRRPDPIHGWGMVALGAAGVIGLTQELTALHASSAGHAFRWWWPTNWMAVPVAILVAGVIMLVLPAHREREIPAGAQQPALPPVNPAEWKAICEESGEFADGSKALVFGLRRVPDTPGWLRDFGALHCTVTGPDGYTAEAMDCPPWCPYTARYFPAAREVAPGRYRSAWRGRMGQDTWVDITSGEHEVMPPPKTGLEVGIDGQDPTPFPGVGLILEIKFHVANHDLMEHRLSYGLRDGAPPYHGPHGAADDPEHARFRQQFGAIWERRGRNQRPETIAPGETLRGIYVADFGWDPVHRLPLYTLVISDGRRDFPARPAYADDEPAAG